MRQAAAFRLKPNIDIGELSAKMDHRMHRLTKELEAHGTAPTSKCKRIPKALVGPGGCRGGAGRPACRQPGAGQCSLTT